MGWKELRLAALRMFAFVLIFWLTFAGRGAHGQSTVQEPPSQDAYLPAPAVDDAATRMDHIESQLQALDARNKQLERQHKELMGKYQKLLHQGNQPVFGAEENNPDGMGVPGAIITGVEEVDNGGGKAGKEKKTGEKAGEKKDGKKDDKKDGKKDDKKDGKKDETKKEADEWYVVGSDGGLKAVWRDRRLYMESAHKDFRFRFTGRINYDIGSFDQTKGMPNYQSATAFRRARIGFEGYLYGNFYFRARYDFANSSDVAGASPGGHPATGFKDDFVRLEHLPFISNFQAGLWKEMINLTWQSSSNQITFMERAAVINALNPGRTDGVATFRSYFNERMWFGTGLFRSVDNAGGFSQGDGGWASTSRLVFLPFYEDNGRYLVHLGGSYSHRAYNHTNDPAGEPRFATIGDIAVGSPDVLDTGFIKGASNENLLNGEFVTLIGPLSIQAEAMMVSIDTPQGDPVYWGTYAQVSYFLTGENRRYRRSSGNMYGMSFTTLNVNENFFTLSRWPYILGRGAWEIAARYDYLDLSGGGFVVPTSSSGAGGTGRWNGMTYGLNWYLNDNTTIMLDYVHGWRHSDTPGRSGQMDTIAMRFRFYF